MSHATIDILFWLTMGVGLPLGILLYVMWVKKIFPAMMRSMNKEKRVDLESVAMKALFFGFPGLVMMIVCAIPVIYFGHLRKQFDYCVQVVQVNKQIERGDDDLKERCGAYDVEELFREAGR